MALYALTQFPETIYRTDLHQFIPVDPGNVDYVAYQKWLTTPGNVPDPLPAVVPPHVIPALTYIDRFTAAELAAIQNFSITVPPTAASNAVYNFLYRLPLMQSIDLTAANTIARHTFLVNQSLLTAPRSAMILTP